jgi:hypothetical protein
LPRSQRLSLRSVEHLVHHLGECPAIIVVLGLKGRHGTPGGSAFPAVQNLLLAARALGLGGSVFNFPLSHEAELRETLRIPENNQIYCLLPIGYPTDKQGPWDASRSARSLIWTRSERRGRSRKSSRAKAGNHGGRNHEHHGVGRERSRAEESGVSTIYPDGMHNTIARLLAKGLPGSEIATATLEQPEHVSTPRDSTQPTCCCGGVISRITKSTTRWSNASRSACSTAWADRSSFGAPVENLPPPDGHALQLALA